MLWGFLCLLGVFLSWSSINQTLGSVLLYFSWGLLLVFLSALFLVSKGSLWASCFPALNRWRGLPWLVIFRLGRWSCRGLLRFKCLCWWRGQPFCCDWTWSLRYFRVFLWGLSFLRSCGFWCFFGADCSVRIFWKWGVVGWYFLYFPWIRADGLIFGGWVYLCSIFWRLWGRTGGTNRVLDRPRCYFFGGGRGYRGWAGELRGWWRWGWLFGIFGNRTWDLRLVLTAILLYFRAPNNLLGYERQITHHQERNEHPSGTEGAFDPIARGTRTGGNSRTRLRRRKLRR